MATIKIYTGQSTVVSMENTGSVSYADMISFLQGQNINTNDTKFVLYQGKLELTEASVIPSGDQKIMASASKTKAGGFKSDVAESLDNIQEQLDAVQHSLASLKAEFAQKLEDVKNFSTLSEEDKEVFAYMQRENN